MPTAPSGSGSIALLAGASGLVGQALLSLLLADARWSAVHLLLRRPLAGLPTSGKCHVHTVNFAALPALPPVDEVFIALGTTIKQAGSQAAFRAVDFDAVVNTARAARAAGATRLAVVSALGADRHSRVSTTGSKAKCKTPWPRSATPAWCWPSLRCCSATAPRWANRCGQAKCGQHA